MRGTSTYYGVLALALLLTACERGAEPAAEATPGDAKQALEFLKEGQESDGDEVLSAALEPASDGRFAGPVTIRSSTGETAEWTCSVRPPALGRPKGSYSCHRETGERRVTQAHSINQD